MILTTFGINPEDVIKVMNLISNELIILGVALALAIVVTVGLIFLKKLDKPLKGLIRGNAWLAFLLVVILVINMLVSGSLYTMANLALGGSSGATGNTEAGSISAESIEEAYAYNEEIAGEGMTLLENSGILPLAKNTKLNVFGWASVNPVYGGVGSGALNSQYATTSLIQGLEEAGFVLNQELIDLYSTYYTDEEGNTTRPSVGMWAQDWTLPEPNVNMYTDEMIANAKAHSDVAVVVIGRPGGENADLPWDMTSVVDGSWLAKNDPNNYFNGTYDDTVNEGNDWDEGDHYLQLSNREEELLELVCANFDKVVVIINTNNAIETGFVDQYEQIQGVIYCPCPGQNGFAALGSVLCGDVNPSGKTVDTWLFDQTDSPAWNNMDFFVYDNMEDLAYYNENSSGSFVTYPGFVNYVEGIYVGYRFFETAAVEGLIDYDSTVAYPFGYGLSYTTFTQEIKNFSANNDTVSFDVVVTNTGSVAGKEVVEVYFNPPYTNGGIEKSVANLVAFDKTGVIEPGKSETIHIEYATEDMASYDEYNHKAYVLEKGAYVISVNGDSHTVLDSETWTLNSDIVYTEGRASDQQAATNIFGDAYGDVTYLSRKDGFTNYDVATAAPTSLSMAEEYKARFINNSNYDPFALNDPTDEMPTLGANNGIVLADLRGAEYDDPAWDLLLDQLTVDDMVNLIGRGGYCTAEVLSVGKVGTYDCDGPASINNNFTQEGSIGFCGSVMVSSSWNTDMSYMFGNSIGQMAGELGTSGWYAPAMNIHRTAFSGRNFEYWSEDGVLSGYMAAAAVQGAEAEGVYSYIKHFALNDQESGRTSMICVWSCEQAIREIYTKSFEIAVKKGGADAVMTSFTYIGTTWCGGYAPMQQTLLRDEWGFEGMSLTDYYGGYGYMDADQAIRNGSDFCLAPMDVGTNILDDQESATSILEARDSCHRILYTVVNSRAYEGVVSMGTPAWLTTVQVISWVLVALLAVWEFFMVKGYLNKKKAAKA